jgi:hypothetical protein
MVHSPGPTAPLDGRAQLLVSGPHVDNAARDDFQPSRLHQPADTL